MELVAAAKLRANTCARELFMVTANDEAFSEEWPTSAANAFYKGDYA